MPKLRLKRTPEEEAAHRLRKEEKKQARQKRGHHHRDTEPSPTSRTGKRRRTEAAPERKWASSDEDEEYGPQPASSASYSGHASHWHEPDQGKMRAGMEEMQFREKLFDAFADDERLDALEAQMNNFAHVPERWRTASTSAKKKFNLFEDDEWLKVDPQTMDEEEYAEWIRMGMYRKTHANEYAEQQRQKAAQAARLAEEKARREETVRLAQATEEERKVKQLERDTRRWICARDAYHSKWKAMLDTPELVEVLRFIDIPWPVVSAHREKSKHRRSEAVAVTVDDLTVDAISAFLLREEGGKRRKEVLRETILRFHPDKFEGRFMKVVRENEQDVVREGIGRVVRALNRLMQTE